MNHFDSLPIELTGIILDYAEYGLLTRCVCRAWDRLVGERARYTTNLMTEAAYDGFVGVLDWGYAAGCLLHDEIWEGACHSNSIEVLEWARSHNCPMPDDNYALIRAIKKDRLNIVQWLVREDILRPIGSKHIYPALKPGRIHILKWLIDESNLNLPLDMGQVYKLTEIGDIDLIKWAMDRDAYKSELIARSAIECGHMHVLEWLSVEDNYTSDHTYHMCHIEAAICSNDVDMLKYLVAIYPGVIESEADTDGFLYYKAVETRRQCVAMLEYLKNVLRIPLASTNIDFRKSLLSMAIVHAGHVEVIQWIIANANVEPDLNALIDATCYCGSGLTTWLRENYAESFERLKIGDTTGYDGYGCHWEDTDTSLLRQFSPNVFDITALDVRRLCNMGDLEMLQWLYAAGKFTLDNRLVKHADTAELVSWLIGCGCMPDTNICDSMLTVGRFGALRWLVNRGYNLSPELYADMNLYLPPCTQLHEKTAE